MTMKDRVRGPLLIPAFIAAAGALMLVYQWRWGRMLWLDEEMIAINLRDRTLAQLAGRLDLGQAAPYGWLAIQRAMFLWFGPGERVLRALPVAFGIAFLVTAVWVGRRWMTSAGAISLTFLCAAGQWVSFYALELKHYSADTCFGLLLPALAAWAIEEDRVLTWWIVAAIAQWFSNGALFVAPACAVVIIVARGVALRAALPGFLWVASFTLNYIITLGPARSSEFLLHYWANAFPPSGAGPIATIQWVGAQLAPLALKPAGSGYGVWFWIVAGAGFAFATRSSLAPRVSFALVPLSGLVWSAIRLVPMIERLSLWMAPSLYVGVAFAADAAWMAIRDMRSQRRTITAIVAAAASVILVMLVADVARRGTTYLALTEPESNHEVDDRAAVRWLARQLQPGDVWVTTHNALAAVWWYANDKSLALEVMLDSDPTACGTSELGDVLGRAGASRALVYLGFGHEIPPQFDDALVGRLGALGRITTYNRFGQNSHALVVDLRDQPTGPITLALLGSPDNSHATQLDGCIRASPAGRW